MSGASVRVVKVGGSLLDWPQLPVALRAWLHGQPPAVNVLLAGGGRMADVIRRADRDFALGEERAHWLCVAALGVTAKLFAAILNDVPLVASLDELRAASPGTVVFDPCGWLASPDIALPHTWDVTSDSIAARMAIMLHADELVLLKSAAPPTAATHGDLATAGYVDRYFPKAAAGMTCVRCVDLRSFAHEPARR